MLKVRAESDESEGVRQETRADRRTSEGGREDKVKIGRERNIYIYIYILSFYWFIAVVLDVGELKMNDRAP